MLCSLFVAVEQQEPQQNYKIAEAIKFMFLVKNMNAPRPPAATVDPSRCRTGLNRINKDN